MSLLVVRDKNGKAVTNLFRQNGSGIYWAVKRINGKIRKRSLETTDFQEARQKLADAIYELVNSKPRPRGAQPLLQDDWNEYFRQQFADEASPATITKMKSTWENALEPFFGNLTADKIHPGIRTDYIEWHRANRPGLQLFNAFKYLGALLHSMVRSGRLEPSRLPDLRLPTTEAKHHEKKKGRYYTPAELKSLDAACADHSVLSFMVPIAHICGPRLMEMGKLRWDQFVESEDGLKIVLNTDDTKTGMAREIPVPKGLKIPAKTHDVWVFPNQFGTSHVPSQTLHGWWTDVKLKAKIKGRARYHDLRHTAATNFAKVGINPMIACTLLGMSFKMYQRKYLQLTAKDIREALQNAGLAAFEKPPRGRK